MFRTNFASSRTRKRSVRWGIVFLVVAAFLVVPLVSQTFKTVTVKKGDTLWDLAVEYLGSGYLYPKFLEINTLRSGDPDWIYPGEVLNIPGTEEPVAEEPAEETPEEIEVPVSVLEQMLTDMNERLSTMSAELASIREELRNLNEDVDELGSTVEDVQARSSAPPVLNLETIEERVSELDTSVEQIISREVEEVQATQAEATAEVKRLKGELEFLAKSLETQAAIQKKALEELSEKLEEPEPQEDEAIAKKRRMAGLLSVLAAGIAFLTVSATR